ncbi:MAG TPA: MFS transporter, partial [Sphingobacteriaceae bacterium]|nr:MFS transporter [Sphingobacteriaceae bacterium]
MYILRSLYHRNFRIHFIGQAVSLVGSWMQRIAISWLVYSMTGSALMLGIVAFVSLIPSLLLSPFIGSFIDQNNKYRVLVAAQMGLMVQAGVLALLVWFGWHTMPLILILSLMQGIFNAVEVNARQSFMLELVEDKQDLPNAIALNSTVFNAARIVGPAIGGLILSQYGEAWCFLINFLSFIGVLVSLMLIRVDTAPVKGQHESTWEGLKQGYRYLQDHPQLKALILLVAFSSLLVIPYTTLLPV